MGRRIILCVWTAALLCALLGLCHETGLKQAVDTNFKSGTGRYFCSPRRVSQSSSVDVKCKCISILNSWKNFNSKGRNYKVCKRLVCFRGKKSFWCPFRMAENFTINNFWWPELEIWPICPLFLIQFTCAAHAFPYCCDNPSKFLGHVVFDCLAWSNYLM